MPRPARPSGHPSGVAVARRRSRRRPVEVEGEGGSERWLVTYADMLTLLLVLFIVLFSMSVVNTSKFEALKASLASVFGNGASGVVGGGTSILDNSAVDNGHAPVNPGAPAAPLNPSETGIQTDLSTRAQQEVQNFQKIERAVNRSLDRHGMSGDVQFSMDRRGLVMTVVTNALVFPGNSAELQPEGQRIIAAIAPPLRKITNQIAVNGYTNQVPASTYPYPTGWELSSARASAVVRQLIADGVAEPRLSATGYNDLDPLVSPSNPHAATRNRRVDIVVVSNLPNAGGDALEAAVAAAAGGGHSPATAKGG